MSTQQKGNPILERNSNAYPSPFHSIASTFLPATVSEMYRWCEHYYVTVPEVYRVINDMATFPITELSIDDENEFNAKTYRHLFTDVVDLKSFAIEIGLDYFAFGNGFATVMFPFEKYMTCKSCKDTQLMRSWKYKIKSKSFIGECRRCGSVGPVEIREKKLIDKTRIRLVRWSPRDIRMRRNSVTGEMEYRYIPSLKDRTRILQGDRFMLESTPQVIIDAILNQRQIQILDDNFFHFRAPSPSLEMLRDGTGLPLIMSVMKLLHYMNVLRRGSEAVAQEHIAPLRWLSPAAHGGLNPAEMIDLRRFREEVLQSIREQRQDPNHVAAIPMPVNAQNFGGDANALFVGTEIDQTRRSVSSGLGVTAEFFDGSLSFSGSSVSLRLMGNRIHNYMRLIQRFMRFTADRVGIFLGLDRVQKIGLVDFKMLDDPQRLQILMSLQAQNFLAGETVLREALGKELDEQIDIIRTEQEILDELLEARSIRQAESQAKAQIAMQQVQQQAVMMGLVPPPMPMGGDPMAGGDPAAAGGDPNASGGDPSAGGDPAAGGAPAPAATGLEAAAQAPAAPVEAAGGVDPLAQGVAANETSSTGQGELTPGSQPGGVPAPEQSEAWRIALQLSKMPPAEQQAVLGRMVTEGRGALAQQVAAYLAMASVADMRPMPQQGAPQRQSMGLAPQG